MTFFKTEWYDEIDKKALGAAMQELRRSKGVKALEIAERCCVVPQVISNYETGRSVPNFFVLMRYMDGLGLTLNTLKKQYKHIRKGMIKE